MSAYSDKLNEIVEIALAMDGSSGYEAIQSIINDIEVDGPIYGLLFRLDCENFDKIIDLFVEFKNSGRRENFNAVHAEARARLNQ
jgi:hypothetical protein